ncbi:MAG: TonB-dependent receptor, partial [Ginsengibacter sp.]
GTVTDEEGHGIEGASVNLKGTSTGTITDTYGNYSLDVTQASPVLVYSYVGFLPQEVQVNKRRAINVTLRSSISNLDEVVVVGYGSQKKRDVTGAISSVSSAQIKERQPINVFDALQGQAPGLQIAQESGRPGASSSVRIRGTATLEGGADPLYIVDGAQGVNIDGINPSDIESIEILRDAASAAIYGSRSANGVIIITTKKGKEGKPRISLQYLTTFGNLAHKVPQANAADRRLLDLKRSSSGVSNRPTDSLNPGYNADNDYQDLLTRTGKRNQVDLSVSGGAKTMNYYASLGYIDDQGIIENSWAKTARARFNVDFKPSDKFTFGSRVQASYQKENRIDEGRTLQQAIQRPPNFRIYFQDGTLSGLIGGRRNPLAEALYDKNNYDIYNGDIYGYASYNFLKELKFTVDANVAATYSHNLQFFPKLVSSANPLNNSIEDHTDYDTYWQTQAYFNYDKTFGSDHHVIGVFGVSADEGFTHTEDLEGTNLVTETVLTLNSAQVILPGDTHEEKYFSNSVFARLGYSYKGKYLINSNFRADASSRFGKDNRWGYFPSASVGWRFSEEKFMDWSRKYLDDGKIRMSYGVTGNDRIGPYESILRYTFGSNYYNGLSGVATNSVFGNNELSWESTTQFNVGADLTLLKGRLSITADYYNKVTTDLLYSAPLPSNTGFNSVKVNVGSIQNKGFEFLVSGYPIRNSDLQWNISYNMSFNNNTVKELYGGTTLLPGSPNVWIAEEGGRLGDFYGYKALGVYAYDESNAWTPDWQQLIPVFDNGTVSGYTLNGKSYSGEVKQLYTNGLPSRGGDMIWQNTNKDSVIDDNDRIILGNAQPKWIAGLTNLVNYKQFSLSFSFYVSWGGNIYDNARAQLNRNVTSNVTPEPDFIQGAWWHQGDVTTYPIAKNNSLGNNRDGSSLYIEDASFIRLRNLRLSYELPKKITSKIKMNGLSVYLYGNNLLTWTNYRWYDPEISLGSALTSGLDSGRFPKKREFGGGINLNF